MRVHILDAGTETTYHAPDWNDMIVEIEAGVVELETRDGTTLQFGAGDVLCLTGLPVRAFHNRGDAPAVLVTATRRPPRTAGASRPPLAQPEHDQPNSTHDYPQGAQMLRNNHTSSRIEPPRHR